MPYEYFNSEVFMIMILKMRWKLLRKLSLASKWDPYMLVEFELP